MGTAARLATGCLVGLVVVLTASACSGRGDLSIENEGPDDVTVRVGDEERAIDADGGVLLLDYGCTPGDVIVTFASGEAVVLPGPVCSDQRVVIDDGTATLRPARGDA